MKGDNWVLLPVLPPFLPHESKYHKRPEKEALSSEPLLPCKRYRPIEAYLDIITPLSLEVLVIPRIGYFGCLICFCSLFLFGSEERGQYSEKNERNKGTRIMETNELTQSVMQGRLEAFRSFSIFSPLPGSACQENSNGSFLYSSGIDCASCNCLMSDKDTIPTDQEIENAITFFERRKLPFIWWTSAKLLETKGFQFGGNLTGIALDISREIPQQQASSNIQITIVKADQDLHTFATLAAQGFGMSAHALEQFQAVCKGTMLHEASVHFLALFEGIAVGAVTLSTSLYSAGIWNGTVLPEYRKNGIGTALVSAAIAEAKKRSYTQVMAVLMPKGMAWGLCTKLGFKEICQFPFYVYGASAEELEQ